MRVITGSAGGRRLNELKGYDTRPTTDKVKEGLFSAIQFEIEGRDVLDLFAGTGQLGIEALSRGANSAVFVEKRRDAAKLVEENLALTRLSERAQVRCGDALGYLSALSRKFDIIFLDPPYAEELLEKSLKHIAAFDILNPHGIIVAESPLDKVLPELPSPYRLAKEYRYGKIKVSVYRRDGEVEA
ncbi:MAG: 16S rRNA (guanine(966)-N(2))-methyltransferase RsmD [Oscillospiraceae bacterium]|nr:16S rRNA (guanine(966)-N(2))-methyltransferase RsmD [Oscillospiraceae bacterium]